MEYLEKLDFILLKISKTEVFKEAKDLILLMDNKISENEITPLLDKLKSDGNVDFIIGYGYRININGKIRLQPKNGYVDSKLKQDRQLELSEKSYSKAKTNTNWVIATFILTIFLFILGIILKKYCWI